MAIVLGKENLVNLRNEKENEIEVRKMDTETGNGNPYTPLMRRTNFENLAKKREKEEKITKSE